MKMCGMMKWVLNHQAHQTAMEDQEKCLKGVAKQDQKQFILLVSDFKKYFRMAAVSNVQKTLNLIVWYMFLFFQMMCLKETLSNLPSFQREHCWYYHQAFYDLWKKVWKEAWEYQNTTISTPDWGKSIIFEENFSL